MKPVLIEPPQQQPVQLSELKAHANIDFDDDDFILETYLKAAINHLDGWTGILGRAIINQKYQIVIEEPSLKCINIPFDNVKNIVISSKKENGETVVIPAEKYRVIETILRTEIRFVSNECFQSPLVISFVTGYGDDASATPAPIKVAILLLACTWYEQREATSSVQHTKLPYAVDALIAPYRRVTF